jgi:tryptophanyl-tRNA synthetase
VFQLHKIFSSKEEQEEVANGCSSAKIGCIDCKNVLIKNIFRVMEPIWARRQQLINDPEKLREILNNGTEKARRVAQETMIFVREAMGLY